MVDKAVALFPGSFKPPHADHLHGIRYLLERGDVEQVVVIISNRARLVPDSHLALDAASSHLLMHTLLHASGFPMERIRIEVAEHRATSHANAYLDRCDDGRTLYFCVGSADRDMAQQRFPELAARARRAGTRASIIVLPSPPRGVHATEIRAALGRGVAGRSTFIAAMPECLTEAGRYAIWAECMNALQPMEKIARRKVRDCVATVTGIEKPQLEVLDSESASPDFVLRRDGLPDLIVKYAGDTTGSSNFAAREVAKPARRLAVERRAIKHVATHMGSPFLLPRVEHFDKVRRILILESLTGSQKAPDCWRAKLQNMPYCASLAGRFLSQLHRLPLPSEPFWGDAAQERQHWHSLLANLDRISGRRLMFPGSPNLMEMAEPYATRRVLHLDFTVDKLTAAGQEIAVEGFERAGSFGDNAYDLATFIASLIVCGWRNSNTEVLCVAIEAILTAYHSTQPAPDKTFWQRLMTYVACCLPSPFHLGSTSNELSGEPQRHALAVALCQKVSAGAGGPQAIGDLLSQCARQGQPPIAEESGPGTALPNRC